ncbi:MAG: glucokinase [Robiginitomaculum sp.]|nr:MAG: glucokinase [Robiginitomaculum sp.]
MTPVQGNTENLILVGDVGGTNVRLGLADRSASGKITIEKFANVPGDSVPDLDTAIAGYLKAVNVTPKNVALALAGPIKNNTVVLTNRPWTVSGPDLAAKIGAETIKLYNDFEAMARSIPELEVDDFDVLNSGKVVENTPILVAGPGTGFGMAFLVPVPGQMYRHWKVIASEGGHVAFTPQNQIECEILHILQQDHEFVSLELVCSGKGLDELHKAVCKRQGQTYNRMEPGAIHEAASAGDPVCLEVCEVRAAAIMCSIGDMALTGGTRSGVILAGGVTSRLMEFINTPKAMKRYFNRGLRSPYMESIPMRHLHKPSAALYGAAALFLDEIYDY